MDRSFPTGAATLRCRMNSSPPRRSLFMAKLRPWHSRRKRNARKPKQKYRSAPAEGKYPAGKKARPDRGWGL